MWYDVFFILLRITAHELLNAIVEMKNKDESNHSNRRGSWMADMDIQSIQSNRPFHSKPRSTRDDQMRRLPLRYYYFQSLNFMQSVRDDVFFTFVKYCKILIIISIPKLRLIGKGHQSCLPLWNIVSISTVVGAMATMTIRLKWWESESTFNQFLTLIGAPNLAGNQRERRHRRCPYLVWYCQRLGCLNQMDHLECFWNRCTGIFQQRHSNLQSLFLRLSQVLNQSILEWTKSEGANELLDLREFLDFVHQFANHHISCLIRFSGGSFEVSGASKMLLNSEDIWWIFDRDVSCKRKVMYLTKE